MLVSSNSVIRFEVIDLIFTTVCKLMLQSEAGLQNLLTILVRFCAVLFVKMHVFVQVYAYVTSTLVFMFFLISTELLPAQLLYEG